MKTVALFGYGKMGKATAKYLKQFGYSVRAIDSAFLPLDNVVGCGIRMPSMSDVEFVLQSLNPHLVVSTLPYFQNIKLASECIKQDIPYADLGGRVENTRKINEFASERGACVFTDLGLAPGLINILCEHHVNKLNPRKTDDIMMAVGGIPVTPSDGPFNYHCTWSLDGLINEYVDHCTCLVNGRVFTDKSALFGHETLRVANRSLEAFMTSGAAAHSIGFMQQKGFQNFVYKTLRYVGHRNFIKCIADDYPENLGPIIKRLSDTAPVKDDLVVGLVRATDHDGEYLVNKEFVIGTEPDLTAMQRATAGPLAVVASMMLDGYLPRKPLVYQDVVRHFCYFRYTLAKLGIEV